MVHVTARVREILDHDGRLIEVLWLDANGEEYRTYIRQVDDPVDEEDRCPTDRADPLLARMTARRSPVTR